MIYTKKEHNYCKHEITLDMFAYGLVTHRR